jgi:hypothetical protein
MKKILVIQTYTDGQPAVWGLGMTTNEAKDEARNQWHSMATHPKPGQMIICAVECEVEHPRRAGGGGRR